MAKKMVFRGVKISFPTACVVCGQPAEKEYTVSRTIPYGGNHTVTISLPVPMCAAHHQMASHKNAKEQGVERAGMIVGGVLGLAAAAALLAWWSSTGQGSLFFNLLIALFVAAGLFLIVWMITLLAIAPNFADPDSKAARNAIQIKRYTPANKQLLLEFANDQIAERVAGVNPGSAAAE